MCSLERGKNKFYDLLSIYSILIQRSSLEIWIWKHHISDGNLWIKVEYVDRTIKLVIFRKIFCSVSDVLLWWMTYCFRFSVRLVYYLLEIVYYFAIAIGISMKCLCYVRLAMNRDWTWNWGCVAGSYLGFSGRTETLYRKGAWTLIVLCYLFGYNVIRV